ncbi:MFS transporter [Glaciimonas soli]|uniref:MFS transporter n=1 Tax=Glaciimonas soli TaxID=2590999 RepID=A0A843YU22_9BURK|nr:MFS transporter [Glaciimonas soli]MQR00752.1 MFS transporter [Glaciimonas soli]
MNTLSVPATVPVNTALPQHAKAAPSRRVIVAAVLGNALELFDFTVYSFFAVIIGKLFFPVVGEYSQLMLSFATFGIGFLARPLGGIVLGIYADRAGRKAAMTLTILLMASGTAIIGLAPTYAQIGLAAPLLIVIARLIQGFSAGAETGIAMTFLMESAPPGKRGYLLSWQVASQGAAALAGAACGVLLTHMLSPAALESWGWRVPFLLGLLIGPVGMYIRNNLEETHTEQRRSNVVPKRLQYDIRRIILGTLIMLNSTATMYIMVYFLPSYLVRVAHMPASMSLYSGCLAGLILTIGTPLCGKLADRLSKRKPILYVTGLFGMAAIFPVFITILKTPELTTVLSGVALMIIVMALQGPAGSLILLEGFPREMRVRSMAIMYSISVSIFGGFSPFLVTWIIKETNNPYAPAWYLFGCALVSLIALILFEEKKVD